MPVILFVNSFDWMTGESQLTVSKSKSEMSRARILDAARDSILSRGFAAMTVDAVCQSAGITKGGFFYHFDSKDQLGEAALAKFWGDAEERQAKAPFNQASDPIQFLEGYLDFAIEAYQDPELQKGCMLAIFTMELAESNEQLFNAAAKHFAGWRASLLEMFERAAAHSGQRIDAHAWSDLYISTLEGALLLAKSNNDPEAIKRSLTLYKSLLMQSLAAG
ncbi:MAG TPA: TetR/AcrR family transcriptional regulator [Methylophilaceae bacterium]|jgi:TetR/AcrR family transcriptional repressor of nem operon|nr:TetR/AcrR family transcriptional regulator [Methylophilaceae bacterium]